MVFDLAPRRAPRPRHVDRRHAGISELPGGLGRDTPPDLFGDHRHLELAADRLDALQQAAEPRVAFRLDGLLHGVQVQDQRIGLNQVDGAAAFIDPVPVIELDGTQVGEQ